MIDAIAIDFDGTFTRSPTMFRELVATMRFFGFTPIMVTQRCGQYRREIEDVVQIPDLPIVFAAGQTKDAAADNAGYNVLFWIDDNPYSVSTALKYRDCP